MYILLMIRLLSLNVTPLVHLGSLSVNPYKRVARCMRKCETLALNLLILRHKAGSVIVDLSSDLNLVGLSGACALILRL